MPGLEPGVLSGVQVRILSRVPNLMMAVEWPNGIGDPEVSTDRGKFLDQQELRASRGESNAGSSPAS